MEKVGNTNIIISPYWNYLEELPPLEVPLEFGWGDEILGGNGGGCCCLSFKLFQPAGDPLEGGDTQFLKREKYVSNNIEIYCEKLLGHMTKGHYAKEHILVVGLLQSVMQFPILHAHRFCVLEILKLLLWNNLYLDKAVNPQWIEN